MPDEAAGRGAAAACARIGAAAAAIVVLAGCSDSNAPPTRFPGGGQLVVFVSNRGDNYDIYSMRPDGSDVRRLTTDAAGDYDPDLSPDRRRIAFVSDREGRFRVFVMNADGSGVRRVSPDDAGDHRWPTWSPDGRRLAYVSDAPSHPFLDGLDRIWLVDADGGNAHLGPGPVTALTGAWGPSGRIAYTAVTDQARLHIHTISADAADDRPVTDDALDDLWPRWSPDGRRLVFSARGLPSAHPAQLFTVNADGTGRAPLLTDAPAASEESPVWSPDGELILFESNRGGDVELYTVRLDGTGLRRLTTSPGYDGSASWR